MLPRPLVIVTNLEVALLWHVLSAGLCSFHLISTLQVDWGSAEDPHYPLRGEKSQHVEAGPAAFLGPCLLLPLW